MTARDIVGLVQTLVLLAIALGTVLWSLYRRTDGRSAEDAERAARLDARTEQIQADVGKARATLDTIQAELRTTGEERAVQSAELTRLKADVTALRSDHNALRLALETDLGALRTHCAECNRTTVVSLTRLARRSPDPEAP